MSDLDLVKLEQSLNASFAPGELPFCHDPGYHFRAADQSLCSLSHAQQQRCPAFEKWCAVPAVAESEPERDSAGSTPHWVGELAGFVFWGLILALAVALLLSLRRMFVSRRATAEAALERTSIEPQAAAAAPPVSGDTDVTRLLDKARRAAERGALGTAIDAAHAAAVQGLAAAGHVEVDRDRTNGDYVRELRKEPALQQDFKAIVGRVEVAQFGSVEPTRGTFDLVMDQVLSLLRRLALLTLLLLVGVPLLSCGGSKAAEREEVSPRGLYTLRRLLSEQGSKVHLRVAPLTKIEDEVGLVLVYDTELEESVRGYLLDWVRGGGSAVIVGEQPELEQAAELELSGLPCGHEAKIEYGKDEAPLPLSVLGHTSLRLTPKAEGGAGPHVDATCGGQPYVATAFLDEGSITFMPERELLSNASLSVANNARLVAEQLLISEGSIELVGPWTGDGAQSPLQSIKGAGMMPVVLQLLGLVGLLAIRRGTSFGSRRNTAQLSRRAFADHVRALAATYARGNAGRLASGNYGLFLIEQLKERVCPGQKASLLQLAAALSRRVRSPETDLVRLLVEAKSAFEDLGEGPGVNHQIIRELEQLSLQAGGSA